MSDRVIVHAEYADDGTVAPFQLSTGSAYTVLLPARTLHIRLLDEDGLPRGSEPYRLELSDGELVEGTLDEQGEAKIKTRDGVGELSFPQLAQEDEA